MRKKNIMIITGLLTGGGAERLVSDISKGIQSKFNVYVVVYNKSKNEYDCGGTRINLNFKSTNKFNRIVCSIKRFLKIRKLKKKYKIDCSISFLPHIDLINVLTRVKGEKIILDVVSNMSVVYPVGMKRIIRKIVLSKADFLVSVSEGVRKDVIDNFNCLESKCKTIYNTCDIESINNSSMTIDETNRYFKDNTMMYITSMGSFRHPKGQWHLIKAFSIVINEFPNVKLVLLGDGIYRMQFEKLSRDLFIESSIIMPGFVNNPHAFIKNSDLFVFSSIFEGFGNAIIESLACGVPIVSTDCRYGPREILAPSTDQNKIANIIEECEYGVIIPPFNYDDIDISLVINKEEIIMAKAIVNLLKNNSLMEKYSEKGLIYSRRFDCNNITEKWVECINNCLNNRRR